MVDGPLIHRGAIAAILDRNLELDIASIQLPGMAVVNVLGTTLNFSPATNTFWDVSLVNSLVCIIF